MDKKVCLSILYYQPVLKQMTLINGKHIRILIDVVILIVISFFLLCYFEPQHLFSKTTITGGDTGSHYYTAQYLRDYLLPKSKISGWCQGNLAGFPILQYYFPFPFLMMAILSWIIPLPIAFKLVTVIGTFLLPFCTYLFFRFLKQTFPVPIIGALFSLSFLFNEGNSMWGGNIPSTLAGEFCYSLGFTLSILWLGLLYYNISEKKGYLGSSILLALIGFCHGYTLLFVVFASVFFLFTVRDFSQNLKILLRIHLVALFLMLFWLLPLIAFLPHTTRFSILWIFFDWKQISREVFPIILYPFIGLNLAGVVWMWLKNLKSFDITSIRPWGYLWFLAICGVGLCAIGYRLGVVDVRFLPFFQFFLIAGSAMVFSLIPVPKKAGILLAFIVLLLTLLWVDSQETFVKKWIRSNYAGFEERPLWNDFLSTNQFLKGSPQEPRIVYEHSMLHRRAGSVRAFEAIPLFSGRSTLEGVYIQASLCVPFIFYLQSEISQKASMPIPNYNYSRFNLKRGMEHFKLFNIKDFIVAEPETKAAVEKLPDFRLREQFGPYHVYEFLANPNRYVESLKFKPVLSTAKDWRKLSYKWFRLGDLSVPIVFENTIDGKDRHRFLIPDHLDIKQPPKQPIETVEPLKEVINEEEILIEGAPIGKPVLIKISYHPNWKVEGADRIYLVSPAFMLIFPTSSQVRLYYGRSWPNYVGILITSLTIFIILFSLVYDFTVVQKLMSKWFDRYVIKAALATMALLAFASIYYLVFLAPEFPVLAYNKGIKYFTKQDYDTAKTHFKYVLQRHPQTLIVDQAAYHYAMCFFREKDWDNTIMALEWLLKTYPETGRASEARYHLGLCYLNSGKINAARKQFNQTIDEFPNDIWARFAADRLKEMTSL